MVTFLVCLVVVGGAMAAILVVTMGGAAEQPATGGAGRDRRDRLRDLSTRAASYLVPAGGPPTTSRAIATRLAAGAPAAAAVQDAPTDDLPPADPERADPFREQDTAPSARSCIQNDVGRVGDDEEPPARSPIAALAGPEVRGPAPVRATVEQETTVLAVAPSPPAPVPEVTPPPAPPPVREGPDAAASPGRREAGEELGLRWSTGAGTSSSRQREAPVSRGRRALRRMRGAVVLVVLLLGLGTVLALSLAGLGAALAVGLRAALGT